MKHAALAANENALGAGTDALQALRELQLSLYPDDAQSLLRERLAQQLGTTPDEVCIGAGSTDLIFQIVAHFARGGDVLAPRHTFVAYRLAARSAGARYVETGAGPATDLDALAARVDADTRLVCVVNPANPTGCYLEPAALVRLLERLPPKLPVVLDEAYIEYLSDPRTSFGPALRRRFPNVLVLRTFSKAYGLAGVRVGYALGEPAWLRQLEARRPPFSVSSPAQAAALAALGDQDHLRASVALVREEREWLAAQLTGQGLEVLPSEGNFLCVQVGDGKQVAGALRAQGVDVLSLEAYGLAAWLRVTVGVRAHNERFLHALAT